MAYIAYATDPMNSELISSSAEPSIDAAISTLGSLTALWVEKDGAVIIGTRPALYSVVYIARSQYPVRKYNPAIGQGENVYIVNAVPGTWMTSKDAALAEYKVLQTRFKDGDLWVEDDKGNIIVGKRNASIEWGTY